MTMKHSPTSSALLSLPLKYSRWLCCQGKDNEELKIRDKVIGCRTGGGGGVAPGNTGGNPHQPNIRAINIKPRGGSCEPTPLQGSVEYKDDFAIK